MTWEICVIDDSIPVTGNIEIDDTVCFNASILKLLLDKNTWDEQPVKDLIEELCTSEIWDISAFKHPNIYLKSLRNKNYKPDIIIFDWEYPIQTDVSKDLLKILQSSFSLVFVYTHVDRREEVSREISREEFREYRRRLTLIHKWDDNSLERLLKEAEEESENNFSFRFGKILRNSTSEAIENVLVELGKNHIDFVKAFLAETETKETDIKALLTEKIATSILENEGVLKELAQEDGMDKVKAQNLLSIIKSKFRDEIKSIDFNLLCGEIDSTSDVKSLKELWSYRLYYHPSDDVVRTGDIIMNKDTDEYSLVVTPDCNLNRFWHKNLGYLNLIPLLEIDKHSENVKAHLDPTRKAKDLIKDTRPSSISNKPNRYPDGCFVLPFIKHEKGLLHFITISTAITNIKITRPASVSGRENLSKCSLTYDHLRNYMRIASLSEPFLTPLIQNSLNSIFAAGGPDFPEAIKAEINAEFVRLCDKLWPTT